MDSNNELKEIDSASCTCYCFNDIIKIKDFDFDNMLLDKNNANNFLGYEISYKILIDKKLQRIRFNKVDRFIRVQGVTRYLVLNKFKEINFRAK